MLQGEGPFLGREALLKAASETIGAGGPTLLCLFGPSEIGKSRLLERIGEEAAELGLLTAFVDLEEDVRPDQTSRRIRAELKSVRRARMFTRTVMVEERLSDPKHREALRAAGFEVGRDAMRAGLGVAIGAHPATIAAGGATAAKPLARLARRPLRTVLRWKQWRWTRQRFARLPKGDRPYQLRSRLTATLRLIAPALAADLAALARRRGTKGIVLLLDHHQRSGPPLLDDEDFALSLARELREQGAAVQVVLARDSPLAPPVAHRTESGPPDELPQPLRLGQLAVDPLEDGELRELLTAREVDERLADELVELCLGHPGVAIRCARAGVTPAAANPGFEPRDEESVQTMLALILDQLLEERDVEERQWLRLAALPRVFDSPLLDALAGQPVPRMWMDREMRRGMLQRLGEGPTWQVERVWRGLLLRALSGGATRNIFEHGHKAALGYLERLPELEDPDLGFTREVEKLYHRASLEPETQFDELIRIADRELDEFRTDRCQELLVAAEEMHSLDHVVRAQASLLQAKLYCDRDQYGSARDVLERSNRDERAGDHRQPAGIAIALQLAKVDRLAGSYDDALARLEEIASTAEATGIDAIAAHCAWERSLVLKQVHDLDRSLAALDAARHAIEGLLADDPDSAAREARRFGIRDLKAKPVHMLRHEAELRRLRGEYRDANDLIEKAIERYPEIEQSRAAAHGLVVRAHIRRMEGLPHDALADTAASRKLRSEMMQDERLRAFAMRAEVFAHIALEERPTLEAAELIKSRPIYPAGPASGHLASAELHRRAGRTAEALAEYKRAEDAAGSSSGQMEVCGSWIGTLECLRADSDEPDVEPLLQGLLSHPCTTAMPWLGFHAQLQRACWRPEERTAALSEARRIAGGFQRRGEDLRTEELILAEVANAFEAGRKPGPIHLEHP
jgi:tetratricopeptide (TPR) repeat protein